MQVFATTLLTGKTLTPEVEATDITESANARTRTQEDRADAD